MNSRVILRNTLSDLQCRFAWRSRSWGFHLVFLRRTLRWILNGRYAAKSHPMSRWRCNAECIVPRFEVMASRRGFLNPCSFLLRYPRGQAHPKDGRDTVGGNFLSPFFPWPQAVALWVNWFLVFNLPASGILTLLVYVTLAIGHYVCFGAANSVGNCSGWASLMSNAAARAGKRGCLSLSAAHDLESDVSVGMTSCFSPSADAPLLEDRGNPVDGADEGETSPMMASAAGRGDTDIVRTNSGSTTPGTAPIIKQHLRRRSSEVSR